MSEQKMNYGYTNDNDESLKSKSGGVFGLNSGYITKFEYNPNAGKDETEGDAIDIHVMVGEKEFRLRVYDVTKVFFKGEEIGPDHAEYVKAFNEDLKQKQAVVIHTAKALGVADDTIQTAVSQGFASFAEWAKVMTALPGDDFASKPVDVFLEYQWQISEGQDRTYLQLPKNMKGGRFLCPGTNPDGTWNETIEKGGLVYRDNKNNEHPFTRSKNFMESHKAIRQIEGEEVAAPITQGTAQATGQPKKSTWG